MMHGVADTRFAREEEGPKVSDARCQALTALLPTPSAKRAALTFANVRGFGRMIHKSHLEDFCDADIGGAAECEAAEAEAEAAEA